ncbi:MAG: GIY-YIG nuclease family protein [Flavobacterium sp.]|nr:MAG: GIY-YIG nuclease family protein [Flavobacterium sp.]
MKVYFVYILKCSDGTFYTGFTSDLLRRLGEHSLGRYSDSYTYTRRPIKLMFYLEFTNPSIAIDTKKQIKNWSQAKKVALINGEFDKLPNLAKKRF